MFVAPDFAGCLGTSQRGALPLFLRFIKRKNYPGRTLSCTPSTPIVGGARFTFLKLFTLSFGLQCAENFLHVFGGTFCRIDLHRNIGGSLIHDSDATGKFFRELGKNLQIQLIAVEQILFFHCSDLAGKP